MPAITTPIPVGDEFQVNTYTSGNQNSPTITYLTDDRYIISWVSEDQDGDGAGIFAQIFDSTGVEIGGEFQVNTTTTNDQSSPVIALLEDGSFAFAWTSYGQDGSMKGIYGRVYDENGVSSVDEFQVNTYSLYNQAGPSIAALNDGGFIVTWHSGGHERPSYQDRSGTGIFAQVFDAEAGRIGEEIQINTYEADGQYGAQTTSLNDGGFVVVWISSGQDGGFGAGDGIFGQRYDSNQNEVGSEFQINTFWRSNQSDPSVAALVSGGFVVSWQSEGQDGSGQGIYAQIYGSDGVPIGGNFLVNTQVADDQALPSVVSLIDGGFLVTWQSWVEVGQYREIVGQRFDDLGVPIGDEFVVNTYRTWDQTSPAVSFISETNFTVAWTSSQQDQSGDGVYAQTFTYRPVLTSVIVSGQAQEDQVLTAQTSGVAVEDGFGTFGFQWFRGEEEITGATSNTYALVQEDVGYDIRVQVDYNDGVGTPQSILSDATSVVQNINDPVSGEILITGLLEQNQILFADISRLTDEDGLGLLNFQWFRDGEAIPGETRVSYELSQNDVGSEISVSVSFIDGHDNTEIVTSVATSPILNVNDSPTGFVLFSGSAVQGEILEANTATLTDLDGLGEIFYQWLRNGEVIEGATATEYQLTVNGGVKPGHCGGAKVGHLGASALERAALI